VPHVFVESNWIFEYAAPAHHQSPVAVDLVERARRGEFTLHIPNCCIGEARKAILEKCQPRKEAGAIRDFLAHAESRKQITKNNAALVRTHLQQYEQSIHRDLGQLDEKLRTLGSLAYVKLFGLDDEMLRRATQLEIEGIHLKPYDQAILAGILVIAERRWNSGERMLSFCVTDADLQPWNRDGGPKIRLVEAYNSAHLWVYEDFTLTTPARRPGFG
jgi:hypothetical protein